MLVPLPSKSLHPFRGLSFHEMGRTRLMRLDVFEQTFLVDYSPWVKEAVRRNLIREQDPFPLGDPDENDITLLDTPPEWYPLAPQGSSLWFSVRDGVARFRDGRRVRVRPGLITGSQGAAALGQQDDLPNSILHLPSYIMEDGQEKTRNALRQIEGVTTPLPPQGASYARIGTHMEDTAALMAAYTIPLLAPRLKKLPGWRDEIYKGRHALDYPLQVTGLHQISEGIGASPDGLMGHVCPHSFFLRCLKVFSDTTINSSP